MKRQVVNILTKASATEFGVLGFSFFILVPIALIGASFWFPWLSLLVVAIALIVFVAWIKLKKRLVKLADDRGQIDFVDFARAFDTGVVDDKVVLAVFEQIREALSGKVNDFPLYADDDLYRDLAFDTLDVEVILGHGSLRRAGRVILEGPFYSKVSTVRDLVILINAQPRVGFAMKKPSGLPVSDKLRVGIISVVFWFSYLVLEVYVGNILPNLFVLVIVLITGLLVYSFIIHTRDRRHLCTVAAARQQEDFSSFCEAFDEREIDIDVVRAVFQQVQLSMSYFFVNFPIRAADELFQDLKCNKYEVDHNLCDAIANACHRSLADSHLNPLSGKVKTVGDLVLFFNGQHKQSSLR